MEELGREMEGRVPDGALFDLLAGVDLAGLPDEQKVTAYILAKKMEAFSRYSQLVILNSFEDTAEMAMAIIEPEQTVVRRKKFAEVLELLPRLSEQLRRGELDQARLAAVHERVVNLASTEMITEVEDRLVEVAAGLTRSQLCRRTSKVVAEVDPVGYEQRREKAACERRVEIRPLPDGMAQLLLILPAVEARMAHELLCADARDLRADERTTDQKRVDAFLDRFLGKARDRQVQVHVTISMETLLGLTEDPGLLDGYGPIAADAARELAMQGPWRGILLDEHRRADSLSSRTYRPKKLLREFVKVRDGGTCAAPGCTRPIQELDHVTPWPAGKTKARNLAGFCVRHHHLKHADHRARVDEDGTLHWNTPLGRSYATTPYEY